MPVAAYDLSPAAQVLLVGALLASLPLLWVVLRRRDRSTGARLRALTLITLFLTFDLVLFGAFTRLTDSGLGCPDWPGCYGHSSPVGARQSIATAQAAMPGGPVTHGKAWIEMLHRYLATGVGGLITVLMLAAWVRRRQSAGAWATVAWPTLTFVWVCAQGAFGALTVTMKLFPAIVSLHLLFGYGLLALLALQVAQQRQERIPLAQGARRAMLLGLCVLLLQAASGAWVSTNYAVLACTDFPQCQASWWPLADYAQGFALWRHLGLSADGSPIAFAALTAIHWTHRMLAVCTVAALGGLAFWLRRYPALRRPTRLFAALLALQVATGVGNVVLAWPLAGAVMHTGGAGALVLVLTYMLAETYVPPRSPIACGSLPPTPHDPRSFAP